MDDEGFDINDGLHISQDEKLLTTNSIPRIQPAPIKTAKRSIAFGAATL